MKYLYNYPQRAYPYDDLVCEYFHGDNGAGIGASHQTGWTGLIAPLLTWFSRASAERLLEISGPRACAPRL